VPKASPKLVFLVIGTGNISSFSQLGLFCYLQPRVLSDECHCRVQAQCGQPSSPPTYPSTWSHMPYCSQSSFKRPILSVCPTAAVPKIK
jgi:hypothetical protein